MSRRKQTLTAVKDLSPLPDTVPSAAKRIRRGAADRSREKVRSFVRLLQRDGTGTGWSKGVPPTRRSDVDAGPSSGKSGREAELGRGAGRNKRQRPSSPPQVVTITIRDDDAAEVDNEAVPVTKRPPRQQKTQGRRSARQYAVVDYSKLHFGSSSEPEEEEEPFEEGGWPRTAKPSPQPGNGPRRGRPHKVVPSRDQAPKLNVQKTGSPNNGDGIFICRRCDAAHDTVEEFLTHFETAHCPDLTDEEFRQRLYSNSYLCARCDFHTTEKDELERHELYHTQQPNPLVSKWQGRYHCDQCDFSATNAVTLSHHRKTHQRPVASDRQTPNEGVSFACADCTARFSDRQEVLRHKELVHGPTSFH
ncbi:zinc finger protein-like [Tropilaelaps mercedesae]|uniref:Zinc finger protein-like n=1 Tax=Tropilaelaps mercedesae TaxID=418985 RepID=A0A1V9XRQ0_9ACAR|nr:zinc finger protein-like [Tropilaelaps mercedesae]